MIINTEYLEVVDFWKIEDEVRVYFTTTSGRTSIFDKDDWIFILTWSRCWEWSELINKEMEKLLKNNPKI